MHQLAPQRGRDLGRLVAVVYAQARQNARQFLDIALRVAAVHAHGVQLHEFARVVLVELARDIAGVVQIDQHGRRPDRGPQHVAKIAQGMRADGAVFVLR
ncbi:hypothetical protein D3C85_1612740 [compost metagenome]